MDNKFEKMPEDIKATAKEKPAIKMRSGGLHTAVLIVFSVAIIAAMAYFQDESRKFQRQTSDEIKGISGQLQAFENRDQVSDRRISDLESQFADVLKTVGATRKELVQKARQFQVESNRTKSELQTAIGSKADTAQVEALKQEANTKFESVNSEVGGVKNDVGTVKSDLASTRHDLDGTQRQLMDVRETLTAAVARNASELATLRAKGEREYFEFTIVKKNQLTKVGDIQLVLTKTDPKKGRFTVNIVADDNHLEKKDRTINEPMQFLVGRNMVRYELVVNWVQKDRAGGYLSIPKDKSLAAERVRTASSF